MRLSNDERAEICERYELAIHRISEIVTEEDVRAPLRDYFHKVAAFLILVDNVANMIREGSYSKLTLDELKSVNRSLYEDITGENYQLSYANPTYACDKLGSKYGKLLSFLYTELRATIIYAYEQEKALHTIYLELFLQIYGLVRWEDGFTPKDVKRAIKDFMHDYCDILILQRTIESADPDYSFAKDIIMETDLNNLSYLYRYGDYISDNELRTAEFINSLSNEQIEAMASTFSSGFERGFEVNRLNLSSKTNVNIRYQIGFERIVRQAIHNFKSMGLESILYRAAYIALNKKQHLKIGFHGSSPNKQYDYDHRFDIGIFLDTAFKNKKLKARKVALEQVKHITQNYAGPAVMEVFGEELFSPEDKPEAIRLNKRQQKLMTEYYGEERLLSKEFYKLGETSFTIISYPVSEIGKDFEAIFEDTVKVNTLDNELYQKIQQTIIDVLDKAEYIRILGKDKNRTDLLVKLQPLKDPNKETNFENCVADVNIPVGEIFTSPNLKGTHGVLHVPLIYLNDLAYHDLELIFEDGCISDYSCKNYDNIDKNKSFIKENLLFNYETLPIGEFAIGTNTTAYMMGKKYDIAPKLPILIAEKTGPHFAIGDTCYPMREDLKVYNPDGKEIIARDNEISLLRKTDLKKAYFNCHTDITLPYDEINEISALLYDGTIIPVIKDTRFVLEGTQLLNDAFDK
ncbi:MAG: leucyl aminopeptidase [Anaerolineaceae bacterium]|nr:MAG: leucyl aminopeptidase [Anaerolineaceae bacterium]